MPALTNVILACVYTLTIILSTAPKHHKTEQGFPLVNFVGTFLPPTEFTVLRTSDLEASTQIETHYLFLGIPTTLSKTHLVNIHYKKLILFDYGDSHELGWTADQKAWLGLLSVGYFKTSFYNTQIEILPLRTLPLHFRNIPWLLQRPIRKLNHRRWDCFFIGNPTYFTLPDGSYDQRIEWLSEIKGHYSFFGGLQDHPNYPRQANRENIHQLYFLFNPFDFRLFFWCLRHSKIALLPTGHSRWTYRHFEAMLAGCIPLSTDIHGLQTFIPMPVTTMTIAKDHEKISPLIDQILSRLSDYQDWIQFNKTHVHQYLNNYAQYDKKHPFAWEQFMEQLCSLH